MIRKEDFFVFFSLVPIVFPSCSHQVVKGFPSSQSVPKCVPRNVPNSTWVLIGPMFNSHVYKVKRWNLGKHICFYFASGWSKEVLLLGACPMFPKKLMMAHSILLLNKFSIFVRSTILPWQLPQLLYYFQKCWDFSKQKKVSNNNNLWRKIWNLQEYCICQNSNLINYLRNMCWNCQGTMIILNWWIISPSNSFA